MWLRLVNILTLAASIILLASLSLNIIYPKELAPYADLYLWAMTAICFIFLLDFALIVAHAPHPLKYLLRNIHVLLLSIPYHAIIQWVGYTPTRSIQILLGAIVMLRGVMAMYITLRWLIARRTTRLLWAYILTVAVCTYLSALIFYEYEAPVNTGVQHFSDALWWAAMNMTTVGAEVFPVTAIGKIISVALPIIGMAMFPVFTVYVTSLYDHRGTGVAEEEANQNHKKV